MWASLAFAFPVTATGEKLTNYLDGLNVTRKWLPHHQVDWESGDVLSRYYRGAGTHCSTFVAAAATRLGIYLPNPDDHTGLLANAQHEWLRRQGARNGWTTVDNSLTAQQIANQGCMVVASYGNPNHSRPGHIAIVRPSGKSQEEIISAGPQIIQAGGKNYNSAPLNRGFRHPEASLRNHKLNYYAHDTPFCRVVVQKDSGAKYAKKLYS